MGYMRAHVTLDGCIRKLDVPRLLATAVCPPVPSRFAGITLCVIEQRRRTLLYILTHFLSLSLCLFFFVSPAIILRTRGRNVGQTGNKLSTIIVFNRRRNRKEGGVTLRLISFISEFTDFRHSKRDELATDEYSRYSSRSFRDDSERFTY